MKDLVKVMKALSDPGRVKILKMLEVRELCVCEIQAALELAQPTISNKSPPCSYLEGSGCLGG